MLCLGTCLQTQHLVWAGLCPAELALSCYVMGTQVNFDKDPGEEMLPVEVAPASRKLCSSRALWSSEAEPGSQSIWGPQQNTTD